LLALVTLAVKTVLEWKQERDFQLAQQATPESERDTNFLGQEHPQ
jgi:hypothetical protein